MTTKYFNYTMMLNANKATSLKILIKVLLIYVFVDFFLTASVDFCLHYVCSVFQSIAK